MLKHMYVNEWIIPAADWGDLTHFESGSSGRDDESENLSICDRFFADVC